MAWAPAERAIQRRHGREMRLRCAGSLRRRLVDFFRSLNSKRKGPMNAQNSQAQCACSAAPKFIFPRSGASDVGGLSDQAARQMAKDGTGKMHCLAGIGGGVDAIMANTQAAAKWDPGAWADLFKKAGAKYVFAPGEHHDGFSNWDSKVNPFNAKNYGPHRDLDGDLIAAVRKVGLKTGISD